MYKYTTKTNLYFALDSSVICGIVWASFRDRPAGYRCFETVAAAHRLQVELQPTNDKKIDCRTFASSLLILYMQVLFHTCDFYFTIVACRGDLSLVFALSFSVSSISQSEKFSLIHKIFINFFDYEPSVFFRVAFYLNPFDVFPKLLP